MSYYSVRAMQKRYEYVGEGANSICFKPATRDYVYLYTYSKLKALYMHQYLPIDTEIVAYTQGNYVLKVPYLTPTHLSKKSENAAKAIDAYVFSSDRRTKAKIQRFCNAIADEHLYLVNYINDYYDKLVDCHAVFDIVHHNNRGGFFYDPIIY